MVGSDEESERPSKKAARKVITPQKSKKAAYKSISRPTRNVSSQHPHASRDDPDNAEEDLDGLLATFAGKPIGSGASGITEAEEESGAPNDIEDDEKARPSGPPGRRGKQSGVSGGPKVTSRGRAAGPLLNGKRQAVKTGNSASDASTYSKGKFCELKLEFD